jgi:DNA-binding CsgD family transcriptional regulator
MRTTLVYRTETLVGRADEQAQLVAAVEHGLTGSAVVVEVVGEPGIGKTRLLDELSAVAVTRGLAVYSAGASEHDDRPCAPFVDAVGSLAGVVGDGPDGTLWRYQVRRGVSSVLESLAGDRGLLLVLDDFHWADEESYALLGQLLRRPPRAGIVLAVAYRGRQASDELLAALTDARLPRWRLELEPLDAALFGGGTGTGNPRLLLAAGDDVAARAALSAEIAGLGQREALVVRAAAVAGDPFEPERVAGIAGTDVFDVLAALGELSRRDIVRQVERSPRWEFRHPVVRAAASPDADERLARTDTAEIAVLVETTKGTEPAAAVRWLRAVLAEMPAAERDATAFDLAGALVADGRLPEARALINDLVTTVGWGSAVDRAQVLGLSARTARLMGHHLAARWLSVTELASVPVMSWNRARPLLVEIAAACAAGGDVGTARIWAAMVMGDVGTDPRDRSAVAGAYGLLALAHDFVGQDADEARTRGAELLDGMVDAELPAALDAVVWVGWAENLTERYGEAARHFARGLAVAHGDNHMRYRMLVGLCGTRTWMGRLDEAWALAAEAEAVAKRLGLDDPMVLTLMCQIAVLRGQANAVDFGERAVAAAGGNHTWWARAAAATLAEARLAAGDAERAVAELLDAGEGPGLPALPAVTRPAWYSVLTAAELRQGRVREAEHWATRAAEAAANLGLAGQDGFAALARAAVLRAQGSTGSAADMAGTAAERFGTAGMRLYEGKAHLLTGLAHSDIERAQRDLSHAKSLFVECAAPGLRDLAVNELRRLGARRPRQNQRTTGLTDRESEIAALVGHGLTNREIAARVRLSEKTVETHLGKAFRKLDVSTRAGLVARVTGLEAA